MLGEPEGHLRNLVADAVNCELDAARGEGGAAVDRGPVALRPRAERSRRAAAGEGLLEASALE
eukprot:4452927-Alexandrium_andersonii.AAC.1